MSNTVTMPLELSDRPEVDVQVVAENLTLMPVEPGGVPRVEIQGRRGSKMPIELKREGDRVVISASGGPETWPWPGAGIVRRMTLYVPAHVRARVRQEFGNVFIEKLTGCDLDLSASAGSIVLEEVRGRMAIAVDSGTISGTGLAGTFSVVSQAGSVKLEIDALDDGEHRIRTAMGSVKLLLAPTVVVKLEANTTLGSARVTHPSTADAKATIRLSAELGSIRVKTGNEAEDTRHGDWADWRRLWRDVASRAWAVAREEFTPQDAPVQPTATERVPDAELRKVLEMVEAGKINAPDAERLIRAMGR